MDGKFLTVREAKLIGTIRRRFAGGPAPGRSGSLRREQDPDPLDALLGLLKSLRAVRDLENKDDISPLLLRPSPIETTGKCHSWRLPMTGYLSIRRAQVPGADPYRGWSHIHEIPHRKLYDRLLFDPSNRLIRRGAVTPKDPRGPRQPGIRGRGSRKKGGRPNE
jgi:hypothetical protein